MYQTSEKNARAVGQKMGQALPLKDTENRVLRWAYKFTADNGKTGKSEQTSNEQ